MNPINKSAPNCINQPAECIQWNSGDIPYLGVCNGDYLPEIIWEIVNKLQAIAGEDLSSFDITSLLTICTNTQTPATVDLIAVLTLLRDGEVCLKAYIDDLYRQLAALSQNKVLTIDLKCFAGLITDSYGNVHLPTQEELNQLIITILCAHELELKGIHADITVIKADVNILKNTPPSTVEPTFSTCLDPVVKSTSNQVKSTATIMCDYINNHNGTVTQINTALTNVPSYWSTPEFQNQLASRNFQGGPNKDSSYLSKWNHSPITWADNYNNLLIAYTMLYEDMTRVLSTCCVADCSAIKIGFSVIYDDVNSDYTVRFRSSDGNKIPDGFKDVGSTIVFIDHLGISTPALSVDVTKEENNGYNLNALDTSKPIFISITSRLKNSTTNMYCEACTGKSVDLSDKSCSVCQVDATGSGSVSIVYQVN